MKDNAKKVSNLTIKLNQLKKKELEQIKATDKLLEENRNQQANILEQIQEEKRKEQERKEKQAWLEKVKKVISMLNDPEQREFFNTNILMEVRGCYYKYNKVTTLGNHVIEYLFSQGKTVNEISHFTKISYGLVYHRKPIS